MSENDDQKFQHLQQTLEHPYVGADSFTKLCRFFGGGGSNAFWTACRQHDWESARKFAQEEPKVPQRTLRWFNKNGEAGGYHQLFLLADADN